MTTETATVGVERDFGGWTDYLRAYKVVIDGKVVGRLGPGESRFFEVVPGPHEVFMKVDWGRSEKFPVHLAAGQTARFRCTPHANVLTGLYWATFGFRRYIKLTPVTD